MVLSRTRKKMDIKVVSHVDIPDEPQVKTMLSNFNDDDYLSQLTSDTCIFCGFSIYRQSDTSGHLLQDHKCLAPICIECLKRCLEHQYQFKVDHLFCPICLSNFTDEEISQIHPKLSTKLQQDIMLRNVKNMVKCRFCPNYFIFEPGSIDEVPTIANGQYLTLAQRECCAKYMVTCNECNISSCINCGAVPYHIGETCAEHQLWVQSYVCRICDKPAKDFDPLHDNLSLLTCGDPYCVETSRAMCKHVHKCGHACVGIDGEKSHPPCPECSDNGSVCPYCHKDLWGNICLRLKCNHTIHQSCAFDIALKFDAKQKSGQLTLPLCPVDGCGEFVKHDCLYTSDILEYTKEEWNEFEKIVDRIALQRVMAEGIQFHPEVTSSMSPYAHYGSKAALYWAKNNYRFMIYGEQHIYVDGRISDPMDNETSCPFNPLYRFPVCTLHGYNYMQYKCACCCSIGVRKCPNKDVRYKDDPFVWYCDICYHMLPGREEAAKACKGNCMFSPHANLKSEYYGKCAMCGKVVSKVIYSSRRAELKEKLPSPVISRPWNSL
ncbi:putative E3 ubiquitin-protein ligase MYCBP2 [Histomonas meleagridis]|uniref:putative E3 ubiquitin-protein ligase MYCBP2 n=1 Tax=Histomonas meleagridis TaxID=135588 RepID=UPI00355A5C64|nr:putative E3 ubiquitin-protein ligase MYCBP2 [Histomonas meleagridis]KAH0799746.1 putative E3 ubiquitin-protein ligase MYCBP2 [Histomonas meleagridis]